MSISENPVTHTHTHTICLGVTPRNVVFCLFDPTSCGLDLFLGCIHKTMAKICQANQGTATDPNEVHPQGCSLRLVASRWLVPFQTPGPYLRHPHLSTFEPSAYPRFFCALKEGRRNITGFFDQKYAPKTKAPLWVNT